MMHSSLLDNTDKANPVLEPSLCEVPWCCFCEGLSNVCAGGTHDDRYGEAEAHPSAGTDSQWIINVARG